MRGDTEVLRGDTVVYCADSCELESFSISLSVTPRVTRGPSLRLASMDPALNAG
jgi:hypothetical protein